MIRTRWVGRMDQVGAPDSGIAEKVRQVTSVWTNDDSFSLWLKRYTRPRETYWVLVQWRMRHLPLARSVLYGLESWMGTGMAATMASSVDADADAYIHLACRKRETSRHPDRLGTCVRVSA